MRIHGDDVWCVFDLDAMDCRAFGLHRKRNSAQDPFSRRVGQSYADRTLERTRQIRAPWLWRCLHTPFSHIEVRIGGPMVESKPRKKYCDLVMKGGVTSGIVYPLAVQKLSTEYSFKNIGGTSAGAIAAGVTAAAECRRRRTGEELGFDRVAKLPAELAEDNFLLSLFRPEPSTKRVFQVVLSAMSAKQAGKPIWIAVAVRLLANFFWPFALAVVLVAVFVSLLAVQSERPEEI